MSAEPTRVYVFATTSLAMWAEDVARERGIPAEVVPAPPDAEDKCGLALRTPGDQASALESALNDEGIAFTRGAASPPS